MLRNYLILLLRNLYKRRIYSLVNLVGLAVGIASFLLILLFVTDELTYDRNFEESDRIYRVCMEYDFGGVGEKRFLSVWLLPTLSVFWNISKPNMALDSPHPIAGFSPPSRLYYS